MIGVADDIFDSILSLSDGNLSSKIVLNEASHEILKNINLAVF